MKELQVFFPKRTPSSYRQFESFGFCTQFTSSVFCYKRFLFQCLRWQFPPEFVFDDITTMRPGASFLRASLAFDLHKQPVRLCSRLSAPLWKAFFDSFAHSQMSNLQFASCNAHMQCLPQFFSATPFSLQRFLLFVAHNRFTSFFSRYS